MIRFSIRSWFGWCAAGRTGPGRVIGAGALPIFAGLFWGNVVVTAAESGVITLREARDVAYQRNWDLLASRADVDIATAQALVARQFANPTLAVSSTKVPVNGHDAGTVLGNSVFNRSYDTITAFNQLIEIGGKRRARQASAQAGVVSAQYRLEDAHRQLNLAVSRAYVAVLAAETNTRIQRESAASLRREADIAATRLRAGDISAADKQQIEIVAERLELDAARAETEAQTARIQLQILLGVNLPDGTIRLADDLNALAGSGVEAVPVAESAGAERPDVAAARADLKRAEAEYRLAKANRIPDPTFLVQYEHEPPDKANTLGFGVSFPLPLWNRNQGAIAAAAAARRQAELNADRVAAQGAAELATARQAYQGARQRQEQYSRVIVPQSAAVRQSVTFAYDRGGASLLDLLNAQRNDNEVRLAEAQAAADAAVRLAEFEAARFSISSNPTRPAKVP